MRCLTAVLLLMFSALTAAAPPAWYPDPTFGTGGTSMLEIEPGADDADRARVLVSDAQQRIYLIGTATQDDDTCMALARFLPDGELDSATYGEGGKRCLGSLFDDGAALFPTDALVQMDGKLLIAGYDMASHWPVICRFDASGQLDTAHFGSVATPGCAVFDDVEVETDCPSGAPDETCLKTVAIAAGMDVLRVAMTASGNTVHLARLSLDGHIVPFGQSSTRPLPTAGAYFLSDIAMTSDDRMIITGAIEQNVWDIFLAVVDADSGEADGSFNDGQTLTFGTDGYDVPTTLALTSAWNIVVGGASGDGTAEMHPRIAVVTSQGQFSPSFHDGAPASYSPCVLYLGDCKTYVTGIEALPGGKLLFGGYALQDGAYRIYTMRLRSDGTPDPTYGSAFPGQEGFAALSQEKSQVATGMLMQHGRAVLAGWRDLGGSPGKDFFVTRLSGDSLFRDGYENTP